MSKIAVLLFVVLFAFAINGSFSAKAAGNAVANGAGGVCSVIQALIKSLAAALPNPIKSFASAINAAVDGICGASEASITKLFTTFEECITESNPLACAKAAYAAFVKENGNKSG